MIDSDGVAVIDADVMAVIDRDSDSDLMRTARVRRAAADNSDRMVSVDSPAVGSGEGDRLGLGGGRGDRLELNGRDQLVDNSR